MKKLFTYSFLLGALLFAGVMGVKGQDPNAEPPNIVSVSVEPSLEFPGAVRILWDSSITEGVYKYALYRFIADENGNNGFYQPITRNLGKDSLSYLDITAQANIRSESYKMTSFDSIGEGPSGTAQNTLFLHKIVNDSCAKTNNLKWEKNLGWSEYVYYSIFDGNGNLIQDSITDNRFVHIGVQQDADYSYVIIGSEMASPTIQTTSNMASIHTASVNLPNTANFYINELNYDGAAVNFQVQIDNTTELLGYALLSSIDNIRYAEVDFDSLNTTVTNIEFSDNAKGQPLYYKVNAIGVCHDSVVGENVVRPIVLKSISNETEITLDWNESFIDMDEDYTVSLTIDGGASRELNSQSSKTYYYSDLDPDNSGEIFCFTVNANETSRGFKSKSNTVCVTRLPEIEMPTAFTPNGDGINDTFGPFNNYIKNVDLQEFKIIIYDKYGGSIYVSDNPSNPWTGATSRASLRYVSEGGYIYYLWFKTAQGKTYEKSGTINVVYP